MFLLNLLKNAESNAEVGGHSWGASLARNTALTSRLPTAACDGPLVLCFELKPVMTCIVSQKGRRRRRDSQRFIPIEACATGSRGARGPEK